MSNLPNQKVVVIPDLTQDLFDLCKEAGRPRNKSGNICISFVFLLLFSFPAFSQHNEETIKIGFLIRDKNDIAIQQVAQSAVEQANNLGGYKGQDFELIIKSCDGPWGITSKQAVALIFEDQVPIIVTALDGRNAHLAEQVTAKSHVLMLSTLSSDPTLSRAYVPWYFRMVPDDKQQAESLIKEIYITNKAKQVAVISLDKYDGEKSVESFETEVKQKGFLPPKVFRDLEKDEFINKIDERSWDALVLAGTPNDGDKLTSLIKSNNTYSFLNFFSFMGPDEFFKNVSTSFSPSLDYVHDGISLAIESIQKFGPDAEAIRIGFKDLKYEGATGLVEFDKLGNRIFK